MNSDQAADVWGRGLVVGPTVTVTVHRLQPIWLHFSWTCVSTPTLLLLLLLLVHPLAVAIKQMRSPAQLRPSGILGSRISSTTLLGPGKIWSWGRFSPGIFTKVNDKGGWTESGLYPGLDSICSSGACFAPDYLNSCTLFHSHPSILNNQPSPWCGKDGNPPKRTLTFIPRRNELAQARDSSGGFMHGAAAWADR